MRSASTSAHRRQASQGLDPCDCLVVTNIPSFYKVNLFNEVARQVTLRAVFLAETSIERTPDFVGVAPEFDHVILGRGDFERSSSLSTMTNLHTLLRGTQYRHLLVGGWDRPEYWVAAATSPRRKNSITLESSLAESTPYGFKGAGKRLFMSRISRAFTPGSAHRALLDGLHWRGKAFTTQGVGILNRGPVPARHDKPFARSFLYIGRLAPEKNLPALVQAFTNQLADCSLTIIGTGPEEKLLRANAGPNVHMIGYIDNSRLGSFFASHDCLILPSLRESWGLVVEEAMYHGLPPIVSNRCGAADLIENGANGWVFDVGDPNALVRLVRNLDATAVANAAASLRPGFIDAKDRQQVQAFVSVFSGPSTE